jgi:hypothetical protein
MKKVLLLSLTLLLPALVKAYDFKLEDICYTITSENDFTVEVAQNEGSLYSGDIIIPEQVTKYGLTYTVTSISKKAFFECTNLKSVFIPKTITTIGENAFYITDNLEQITVDVENQYFKSENGVLFSTKGTIIKYPEGKTNTEYMIPDGVVTIGNHAFCQCKNLCKVEMSNSVKTIEDYAFSCENISEIILSESLESIGPQSLTRLAITSITLPNSLKQIGNDAFNGCQNLKKIYIPKNVEFIGDENIAIGFCLSLETIEVDPQNNYFKSIDGVLYDKNVTKLIKCPPCNPNIEWFEIPETVTTISSCAFHTNRNLTRITIPSGVTTIGNGAFYYCSNLNRVTCYARTPPSTPKEQYSSQDPWDYSGRDVATLYIPNGTKSTYMSFSCLDKYGRPIKPWNKFKEIVEMEDNSNGIIQLQTNTILIKSNGGQLTVEGVNNGESIEVYSMDGTKIGSAISRNGVTQIKTDFKFGNIGIVKINNKCVKVIIR